MSLISDQEFLCPYCACPNTIALEGGQGRRYALVTDCEICCRPIRIKVLMGNLGCELEVHAENE